jgi:hypothetical protein
MPAYFKEIPGTYCATKYNHITYTPFGKRNRVRISELSHIFFRWTGWGKDTQLPLSAQPGISHIYIFLSPLP